MGEVLHLDEPASFAGIRTGTVRFRPDLETLAGRPIPSFRSRRDHGRARRQVLKRSGQGEYRPAPDRGDPIARLAQLDACRIAELLPIKMARMATSPLGFFRGAAGLMAHDLAAGPVSGLSVLMCGDAHVQNLGAFAAPDGHLVFDLNDFDDAWPGPWEWDLKRMATSVVLAGREAGCSEDTGADAVRALCRAYRVTLRELARVRMVHLVKFDNHRNSLQVGPVAAVLRRAARSGTRRLIRKLTARGEKYRRLAERPPLLFHVPDATVRAILAALPAYRETLGPDRQMVLDAYTPWDVAFKVVGTGSIGTRSYVVLFYGHGPDDPLFLQVKEARPSPWARYVRGAAPVRHEGERVAQAQQRLQTLTDPFLGWTTVDGVPCIVRQLSDHKASVDTTELTGRALVEYAAVAGEILAKGHARTGDAVALSGYCGKSARLDEAVARFARAYADQTERDHELLIRAIRKGAVPAER